MTSFFANYTSSFNIFNQDQRKLIIGSKGETKRNVEKESSTIITVEESYISISGNYEGVKIAEHKIAELLANNYFEVHLNRTMEGYIIGVSGENIRQIQNQSGAYVRVTGAPSNRKLIIIGKPEEFKKAKELTMSTMVKKLKEQMESNASTEFRKEVLSVGYNRRPVYVKDQLDPSPQLFFLNFNSELINGEEIYTPRKESHVNRNPPSIVNKQSAILAPYQGYLYRAEVLAVELSEDKQDILLTVHFVDFGNIHEGVSYFDCKNIDAKYLYPKIAKPCTLSNISDSWKNNKKSIHKFRKYIKEDKIEKAVIVSDPRSTNFNKVQIILETGDIMTKLVNKGLANYNHHKSELNAGQIGLTSVVYVVNGFSDCATVEVTALSSVKGYTQSILFDDILAIEDAYSYSETFFEKMQSNFLEDKRLNFDLNSKVKLHGSSSGAPLALCVISIGLKKEIPSDILLTGEISKDGSILPVLNVREKTLAAFEKGIKIFYVPLENYNEALCIQTCVEIRAFKHISEVINDIWSS